MNQFILCFPLHVSSEHIFDWMIEQELIVQKPEQDELWIKGVTFPFTFQLQAQSTEIVTAFEEHHPITEEERKQLNIHQSLLFLWGEFKDSHQFLQIQKAIDLILNAGALGIYMDHSGCAFSTQTWLKEHSGESLSGWINCIQVRNTIYTLGLSCFRMPDLCCFVSTPQEGPQKISLFTDLADNAFWEKATLQGDQKVESDEFGKYTLKIETQPLYPKQDPFFNPQGTLRLVQQNHD